MRTKVVVFLLLASILILATSGLGCKAKEATPSPTATATPKPTPVPHAQVAIEVFATKFGGTAYTFGFATSDILNKYSAWVRATAVETPGAQYNIEAVDKESSMKGKTIFSSADTTYWLAVKGKPPYQKKYGDIRLIASLTEVANAWVTLDKNLKSYQDLVGKTITTVPAALALAPYIDTLLNDVWKIGGKTNVKRMAFDQAADALADRLVDAAFQMCSPSQPRWLISPGLQQILMKNQLYAIGIPKEDMERLRAIMGEPVSAPVIPAGTFGPGQSSDIGGLGIVNSLLACYADVPEDIVYEVTKTLAQNVGKYKEYLPEGAGVTPEFMVGKLPIWDVQEIHPGALKYYREVGLIK